MVTLLSRWVCDSEFSIVSLVSWVLYGQFVMVGLLRSVCYYGEFVMVSLGVVSLVSWVCYGQFVITVSLSSSVCYYGQFVIVVCYGQFVMVNVSRWDSQLDEGVGVAATVHGGETDASFDDDR